MTARIYSLLVNAIAVAGFCYLVVTGSPWWGLVCLLLASDLFSPKGGTR